MSTRKVPGAELSYKVKGSGPLLILIPGTSGVREIFHPITHELSATGAAITPIESTLLQLVTALQRTARRTQIEPG